MECKGDDRPRGMVSPNDILGQKHSDTCATVCGRGRESEPALRQESRSQRRVEKQQAEVLLQGSNKSGRRSKAASSPGASAHRGGPPRCSRPTS